LLLDPASVLEIRRLVEDLRRAGQSGSLLDEVFNHLLPDAQDDDGGDIHDDDGKSGESVIVCGYSSARCRGRRQGAAPEERRAARRRARAPRDGGSG
jgi:hypothetical protein